MDTLSITNERRTTTVVRERVGPTKRVAVQHQWRVPKMTANKGSMRRRGFAATNTGEALATYMHIGQRTAKLTRLSISQTFRSVDEVSLSIWPEK